MMHFNSLICSIFCLSPYIASYFCTDWDWLLFLEVHDVFLFTSMLHRFFSFYLICYGLVFIFSLSFVTLLHL